MMKTEHVSFLMSDYHSEGLIIRFPTTSNCTRDHLIDWATVNNNKTRRRTAGGILCEHAKNAKYAKYVQNMQITNAGGDQPMEYYENMPRRELSSLLVRKKRKKDIIRDLVQCLTKNEKEENRYIYIDICNIY